jgi:hypothetical protein
MTFPMVEMSRLLAMEFSTKVLFLLAHVINIIINLLSIALDYFAFKVILQHHE